MKIGLFGGTFDPIHWGHLRNAEEVREGFSLDRLLFIPAGNPPHKKKGAAAPARDRLEMVRLAIAKNPGFALSTVEISRPGKSYSIDTVRCFAKSRGPKNSLYFILGLDAFLDIGSWKGYEEILSLCHFIITSRPGSGNSVSLSRMPIAVRRQFCYDHRKKLYRHKSGTKLFFLQLTDIAISASDIRRRLKEGGSIRYLVPLEVETYIKKIGLYRGRRGRSRRD
ncbi:MAG: nicotinate-nucleotide adenylyltransferase [Deltaproteobacteria bacterium]|nr:nicotinate-nucleotide adenylyltransferase [Deltaproteobacteria bacterium]